MNSHLNYLIAQERATDLIRSADQARLANTDRAIESTAGRSRLTAPKFARLWVLSPGSHRRRAPSPMSELDTASSQESLAHS
jgi:hypothetical protein